MRNHMEYEYYAFQAMDEAIVHYACNLNRKHKIYPLLDTFSQKFTFHPRALSLSLSAALSFLFYYSIVVRVTANQLPARHFHLMFENVIRWQVPFFVWVCVCVRVHACLPVCLCVCVYMCFVFILSKSSICSRIRQKSFIKMCM